MLLENLYAKAPSWIQDLAVSAKGLQYRWQRYGPAYREEYGFLRATERASCLQLELLQVARLRRILAYARQRLPFYQSALKSFSLDALRAGDWNCFYEIPLTEKSMLREKPNAFWSDGRIDPSWIVWSTSGSTGTPLTLYYTREAVSRQYAFVERYREQAGVSRRHRRAQFTGKLIVPGTSASRYWRRDWLQNTLYLSTVHLTREAMPQYLAALQEFRPAYLTGYPSAIALLAQESLRRPTQSLKIPVVLTSAENLLESQREVIEAGFGARVFDQYGQTEMQSFWFECRYGRMHAHPLFGVTEILRANGNPCEPSESGDVVLTGFLNYAMPLIRYRVGDRAAWSKETQCPCGCPFRVIEKIEGRQEDYLYSSERGWVGRMDPALKGISGILECQFVQQQPDSLIVNCVPAPNFSAPDRNQLEHNIRARLGNSIRIEWNFLDAIPRGPNGKFRATVSNLPKGMKEPQERQVSLL